MFLPCISVRKKGLGAHLLLMLAQCLLQLLMARMQLCMLLLLHAQLLHCNLLSCAACKPSKRYLCHCISLTPT